MKKFIIKLLVRWYVTNLENLQITKLSPSEELKAYTFRDPDMTKKLIKQAMTAQTLWHFRATSEDERLMAKGAAMMLQYIKDAHESALNIYDPQAPDESLKKWTLYKKTHRIN